MSAFFNAVQGWRMGKNDQRIEKLDAERSAQMERQNQRMDAQDARQATEDAYTAKVRGRQDQQWALDDEETRRLEALQAGVADVRAGRGFERLNSIYNDINDSDEDLVEMGFDGDGADPFNTPVVIKHKSGKAVRAANLVEVLMGKRDENGVQQGVGLADLVTRRGFAAALDRIAQQQDAVATEGRATARAKDIARFQDGLIGARQERGALLGAGSMEPGADGTAYDIRVEKQPDGTLRRVATPINVAGTDTPFKPAAGGMGSGRAPALMQNVQGIMQGMGVDFPTALAIVQKAQTGEQRALSILGRVMTAQGFTATPESVSKMAGEILGAARLMAPEMGPQYPQPQPAMGGMPGATVQPQQPQQDDADAWMDSILGGG